MSTISNVKTLLTDIPRTRDNDGYLAQQYYLIYGEGSEFDFIGSNLQHSIINARKDLQLHNIELRGERYLDRQKHCNKFRQERRKQQEKPENLKKIYGHDDTEYMFVPETNSQYIKRKILSFFK